MRNTGAARRAGSVRHRRVSGANLEVERFGLPNKPTATPAQLEKLIRCGIGGFTQRTWSMSVSEETAQCALMEAANAAEARAFRLAE